MAHQVAITIITTIRPGETEKLEHLLAGLRADVAHNSVLPFGRLDRVHFARLLVLEEARDLSGAPLAPRLVFMLDCDAPRNRCLEELVDVAGAGLDQIYGHCAGYPSGGPLTRARRLAYLRAHMVRADAVYVNTIGRTVQQIRQEARLREAIQDFLDRPEHDWASQAPLAVRAALQQFVAGDERLRWARTPAASPGLVWKLRQKSHLAGSGLLLLILAPVILLVLPIWLVLLRLHELRDGAPRVYPDYARVQMLAALEDHGAQNQFSAIGYLKPGRFRRLTAVAVLWLVNLGARHVFNRADLAGVKTIDFARWVFTDDKQRLVFASNYDGSLERYMDDFIDKVAWGLNAVFSNGINYPKTRWLVFDGATDEQAFKAFIRAHQVPTQVWYAAYDHLTALNIENNARIRAGLYGPMDADAAEAWLRRL